MVVFEVID